ncbi:MAG: hypothetical protein ACTSR3_23185, partial [Candidatus Helarchaeota archaeon]
MLEKLKEKIKQDNSLIDFFKIPEEIVKDRFNRMKQDQYDNKITYYLTEEYLQNYHNSRLRSALRDIYYVIKPAIPKHLQIGMRKKYLIFQKKYKFPLWPIDITLYKIYKRGIKDIFDSLGLTEIPFINFWPKNKRFALVLTHDVETADRQKNAWKLKKIEKQLGFRSIWNFVA